MSFKAPIYIPQVIQSLELANATRAKQTRLKRELRHSPSRTEAFELLAEYLQDPPPDYLRNVTVFSLVAACHRSGRVTAQRFCRRFLITEVLTVGNLTDRQRFAMCRYLRPTNYFQQ